MEKIKSTRLLILFPLIVILSIMMTLSACSSTTATTPASTTSPGPSASSPPTVSPSAFPAATAPPSATAPGASLSGNAVTIDLTAQNMSFDKSTITVKAGSQVTINFNNKDNGIPHNFAVYTDSSAIIPIFAGQIITGPATATYKFTAPGTPGTNFFRCDVHPTTMTGQFIVQ